MDNTNENMTEDKDINKNNNGNSDDYEKICFVCRRPESRAGKMIVMPNNIYICQDCMQRTFDSINSSGINYEDMEMSSKILLWFSLSIALIVASSLLIKAASRSCFWSCGKLSFSINLKPSLATYTLS